MPLRSHRLDLGPYCRTVPERRLLEAFLTLLDRRPYDAISVLDVVEQAHMSKSAFYQRFHNKADLARTLFGTVLTALLDHVGRAIDAEPEPWRKIRAGLQAYVDLCLDHPGAGRFLLLSAPGTPAGFESLRLSAHRTFADMIRTRLRFPAADPKRLEWLAAAIVGAVNEAVVHALLQAEPPDAAERAELVDCLNQVLVHAVLAVTSAP
ncbi:MAG: TetR/AcrR family transcriptional regulator [Actinomycetia bacterium]|nr:TetR/AcrR family transcriptional regulator [Actinomycetes bacterium]